MGHMLFVHWDWRVNWRCMRAHCSQLVWYRRLFLVLQHVYVCQRTASLYNSLKKNSGLYGASTGVSFKLPAVKSA